MINELNKERLEEIAADGFVAHGEIKAMARALLAAQEQEPVAYAVFANNGNIRIWSTVKAVCDGVGDTVSLYTHPAPSIPAAVPEAMDPQTCHLDGVTETYAEGWNDCRAAILNHPSSNEASTAAAVGREIKQQASNNGWIPVSERLPEDGGRYWCYVEEQNSLGKSHYQWNCSWNGDEWSDAALTGRVTHWQTLPAAPKV